jgi:DNA-binding MarR family transcriptional regulator
MTKKIEDEIYTTKFRSEFHKATLNILVTSHWIESSHADIFKSYKITPQQYNILRILRGQHPKPANLLTIRERMIDKMSDVSRIVERLRIAGLIDRTACGNDRRSVDIKITEKGIVLLTKMKKEEDILDNVLKNLTSEEAKILNNILDKIRD